MATIENPQDLQEIVDQKNRNYQHAFATFKRISAQVLGRFAPNPSPAVNPDLGPPQPLTSEVAKGAGIDEYYDKNEVGIAATEQGAEQTPSGVTESETLPTTSNSSSFPETNPKFDSIQNKIDRQQRREAFDETQKASVAAAATDDSAPRPYTGGAAKDEKIVQPLSAGLATRKPGANYDPTDYALKLSSPADSAFNPVGPKPVTEAEIKDMLDQPLADSIETMSPGKYRENVPVNESPYVPVEPGFAPTHRAPKHQSEGIYAEPEREDAYQGTRMAPGRHSAEVPVASVQENQPPTPVA
jgi:hypothetical protein